MSDPQNPIPQGAGEGRMNRHPLVTILMAIVGIILLLPGLCALVLAVPMIASFGWRTQDFVGFGILWAVCLLISFGGVMLLRKALK